MKKGRLEKTKVFEMDISIKHRIISDMIKFWMNFGEYVYCAWETWIVKCC